MDTNNCVKINHKVNIKCLSDKCVRVFLSP